MFHCIWINSTAHTYVQFRVDGIHYSSATEMEVYRYSCNGDNRSHFTLHSSAKGVDNFKKAVEKFRIHENSDSHLKARIKCRSLNNPSTNEQLSSQAAKVQAIRRAGLMKQLEAMKFLLRQGIALRGHSEEEGNLYQLLTTWSSDCAGIKSWIEKGKYMSHLITLMGHGILR